MSVLVQDVITNALQNIGIVGAGATPSTADNATCLAATQALINSWINAGVMDQLYDVTPSTTTYTANENERIINDGSITVTLPLIITQPGGFGDGTGDWDYGGSDCFYPASRPPRDMSVIQVVRTDTGARNTFLYDNWLRSWTDIENLALNTPCPLAQRDADGLAAVLSERIADKFGEQVGPSTQLSAKNFKAALATNWSQAGQVLKPGNYY